MRTVGQFGAVLGSSPNLDARRRASKGRTVRQFGVTFGSLSEAGLGGFGVTGNLLAGWLGSQLCGRIDRSLTFGDLFGSLLATNSGAVGSGRRGRGRVGRLGWLLNTARLWGIAPPEVESAPPDLPHNTPDNTALTVQPCTIPPRAGQTPPHCEFPRRVLYTPQQKIFAKVKP